MRRALFSLAIFLVGWPRLDAQQHGLKVPPGFEVTEFADAKLANDIYCMTLDPKGRVVVSGRGYIKILVDDDGDGKADRAITFANGPKDGAMGLFWEGNHLYFTGDGGLQRFSTKDGDHADGPPEMIREMKTNSEHAAHAITRGPDGWLYVLCGNNTGIDKSFAELHTSPVKDPVAGCVLRFEPDLKKCEIVADGFRNPYCFDFNPDGELFTWDADNERCVSLPWYEGTRFYHVIPGGNYGWMNPQIMETWRKPPYFLDVVAPVIDMGRGSPTGVTCYRHVQFPEKYRGGIFCCDWTFGKVWHLSLKRSGSSYKADKELFLAAVGDNGFAPTASVVHPETGDLYISIGGRGTRGAVYRIRYPNGLKGASSVAAAKLQAAKRSLEVSVGQVNGLLVDAESNDYLKRLIALRLIARYPAQFSKAERAQAIKKNWDLPDRCLRQAAVELLRTIRAKEMAKLFAEDREKLWPYITLLHANLADAPAESVDKAGLCLTFYGWGRLEATNEQLLALVRVLQLGLGDLGDPNVKGTIWEGYSPRITLGKVYDRIGMVGWMWAMSGLETAVKEKNLSPELQRELLRTITMLNRDYKSIWDLARPNGPVDDLHALICYARCQAKKCQHSPAIADMLLSIGPRLEKAGAPRERNWWLRLGELHAALAEIDPSFNEAVLTHANFIRPEHVVLTKAPGFDRKKAAAVFLQKVQDDPQFPWSADLVTLFSELPREQALPLLRKMWGKTGYDSLILPLLAKHGHPQDRPKFVSGLGSRDLTAVRACLVALAALPGSSDHTETAALIRALGTLPQGKEANQLRDAIGKQLEKTTKQKFGTDRNAWLKWFATVDAKLAGKLANPDGVDVEGWNKRLAKLDWPKGDPMQGQAVYVKASCAACHSGSAAIGPDLTGSAARFSRDDLFTAIIQPSRDVAERYQMTVIETTSGNVYQGIIVYEAVDGLLLVTGPAQNVRIAGHEIAARYVSRVSLMPPGLLDNLLDQEIVDLYAYLKSK
jgi:putative membrane-bound dehydrogenase-like protein